MPVDWITEAISRFIGSMALGAEGARYRQEYDSFRQNLPETEPDEASELGLLRLSAPHQLLGYTPYIQKPLFEGPNQAPLPEILDPVITRFSVKLAVGRIPELPHRQPHAAQEGSEFFRLYVPYPPQVATVTIQQLSLYDDDILNWDESAALLPIGDLHQTLAGLSQIALSLSLPNLPGFADLDGIASAFLSPEQSLAWVQATSQLPEFQTANAELTALHLFGAPLPGAEPEAGAPEMPNLVILVNGTEAEVTPNIRDLVSEDWRETLGWNDEPPEGADDPDPWGGFTPPSEPLPPGHLLQTGGNLVSNEAIVVTNGPDAALIVVAGDLIRLEMISQVAILAQASGAGEASLINAATMEQGFVPLMLEQTLPVSDYSINAASAPQNLQITVVEGDLIFVNRIEQHAFVTDQDRVSVVFTATSSDISLGGNILSNLTTVGAFSSHYDIIIVGGDMVTTNMIEQVSVLYDVDSLTGWRAEDVTSQSNTVLNKAAIHHNSLDRAEVMPEPIRSGLSDAAEDGILSRDTSAALGISKAAPPSILYVKGDLIEQNIIRQTTYAGDSDQVALSMAETRDALADAKVQVETGGNLLINSATIHDLGIDSTIMAAGASYTDAVIYQAGLIDPDVLPSGVKLDVQAVTSDLTPEAVVFLSDALGPDPLPSADQLIADLTPQLPTTESLNLLLS